jgi:hypothetical protein
MRGGAPVRLNKKLPRKQEVVGLLHRYADFYLKTGQQSLIESV